MDGFLRRGDPAGEIAYRPHIGNAHLPDGLSHLDGRTGRYIIGVRRDALHGGQHSVGTHLDVDLADDKPMRAPINQHGPERHEDRLQDVVAVLPGEVIKVDEGIVHERDLRALVYAQLGRVIVHRGGVPCLLQEVANMGPDGLCTDRLEGVFLQEADAVRGRDSHVVRGSDVRLAVYLRGDKPAPDYPSAVVVVNPIHLHLEMKRIGRVQVDVFAVALAFQNEVAAGRTERVGLLHPKDWGLSERPRRDGAGIAVLQQVHPVDGLVVGLQLETIFNSVCHYLV